MKRQQAYTESVTKQEKTSQLLRKLRYVFATITLLFHLKHHKAPVYLTMDFPILPSHPQRTSGDDENNDGCSELLLQVPVFTYP